MAGAALFLLLPAAEASAELYRIPPNRTVAGMESVVRQYIPDRLADAMCGFRTKGTAENGAMTQVAGVPLRPATWRGKTTGPGATPYPETASGLVFSSYWYNEACTPFAIDPLCTDPQGCPDVCNAANASLRYKVYRIAECTKYKEELGPNPADPNGPPVFTGRCNPVTVKTGDFPGDCNTCPENDKRCVALQYPDPEPTRWAYVGEKYQCTGDYDEEHDYLPGSTTGPLGNTGSGSKLRRVGDLRADWGWIWKDGKPDVLMPTQQCYDLWTARDQREYKNCVECSGIECRTVCREGECMRNDSDLDGRPLRPPFDPPNDLYGQTVGGIWRYYDAFYRRYTASHTLATIPGTTAGTDEEQIEVKLACYKWYKERTLNVQDGWDWSCVADDLELEKLKTRAVAGKVEYNKTDTILAVKDGGGFTLDPDAKKTSGFAAPPLVPAAPYPSFGETSRTVTALQTLERRMEGLPPTVQLILPAVKTGDELAILFPKDDGTSVAFTNTVVPLQPGLTEAVRELLRHAIFSRIREEPVPLVLPMVSEAELQVVIEAWEGWKQQRVLLGKDAAAGDKVLAKLADYRQQVRKSRELRAALPHVLATALDRREQLGNAIDAWVASRMAPYEQALGEEEAKWRLLGAWHWAKEEAQLLAMLNTPYCKADRTTPPLRDERFQPGRDWFELTEDIALSPFPRAPRHLVFDFSDVFFEGAENAAAVRIPVLRVTQVALALPLPPSPFRDLVPAPALPDLPPVPAPPSFSAASPAIVKNYAPEPPSSVSSLYDTLTQDISAFGDRLYQMRRQYDDHLWVEEKNPSLSCPYPGASDGCKFPETQLWHVFMRLWAPVGTYLDPGPPPSGAASSWSASPCPASGRGREQCLLMEELVKRSLRVTLPKGEEEEESDAFASERARMRGVTIGADGKVVWEALMQFQGASSSHLFDIDRPQDLYEAFPAPPPVRLEPPRAPPAQ